MNAHAAMSAPATLFDCDTCAANRDRIAQLEAENRWLRRHVQPPGCDRCRSGGDLTYVERFGFHVPVCSECWRPGDRLRLRSPRRTDQPSVGPGPPTPSHPPPTIPPEGPPT